MAAGPALVVAAAVVALDRALGGVEQFPRLIEIGLDNFSLTRLLLLLPPGWLATLGWPTEEAALSARLARDSMLQTTILAMLFGPLLWKWAVPAWMFHAGSSRDAAVLQPVPPSTGLLPWVVPQDPRVGETRQELQRWLEALVRQRAVWHWWCPWSQRELEQAVSVLLLTGPNGVGKTQLALEFARAVDEAGSSGPGGRRWDAGEWLPGLAALEARTGVDPAAPEPPSVVALSALRRWRPRRPTLLVYDEPGVGAAGEVLEELQAQSSNFAYPVALLVVDQVCPAELAAQRPASREPAVHKLALGSVRFVAPDIRKIGAAFQRRQAAALPYLPNLYTDQDLDQFIRCTEGDPLTVALGVHALARQPLWTVAHWSSAETAGAETPLHILPPEVLRHRLIRARVEDLITTWTGGQTEVAARARLVDAVAAASLVGGLTLDGPLSKEAALADLDRERLEQLFPDAVARGRLAGFGSRIVSHHALQAWLARSAAPAARAETIVKLAWAESPERTVRAVLSWPELPPLLRDSVIARLPELPLSVPLMLELARAAVANPYALAPALAALDRLPVSLLDPVWSALPALLAERGLQPMSPLAGQQLLARLAERWLVDVSVESGTGDGARIEAALAATGPWFAAAGPWGEWLLGAADGAVQSCASLLQAMVRQVPLAQWPAQRLQALQSLWLDPQLPGPVNAARRRLLDILLATDAGEHSSELAAFQRLWQSLAALPDLAEPPGETPPWPPMIGDDAELNALRLAIASCGSGLAQPWAEQWPVSTVVAAATMPLGSADPLERVLALAPDYLGRASADQRRRWMRWCMAVLQERLLALLKQVINERPMLDKDSPDLPTVLVRLVQVLLQYVPDAECQELRVLARPLVPAFGLVCALVNDSRHWMLALPAADAGPGAPGLSDSGEAADAAQRWAWSIVQRSCVSPAPAPSDMEGWLAEATDLGATDGWRHPAFAGHARVRAARLAVLTQGMTALINAERDIRPHLQRLEPAWQAWLTPLLEQGPAIAAGIGLRTAVLACASQAQWPWWHVLPANGTLDEAFEGANRVTLWSSSSALQQVMLVPFWRMRAWVYLMFASQRLCISNDGLELPDAPVHPLAPTALALATDAYRREVVRPDLPPAIAAVPTTRLMRATAIGVLITLLGCQADAESGIDAADALFNDELLPALEGLGRPSHMREVALPVTNLLVMAKHVPASAERLAWAETLYSKWVAPLWAPPVANFTPNATTGLSRTAPVPPADLVASGLKSFGVLLELRLRMDPVEAVEVTRWRTELQTLQSRVLGWGEPVLDVTVLGALAMTWTLLVCAEEPALLRGDVQKVEQERLSQVAELIERHVLPLAEMPQALGHPWIEAAIATCWKHCVFLAHRFRRSDLADLYAERLWRRVDFSQGGARLHPGIAYQLAAMLDYQASTAMLTGDAETGRRLLAERLAPLADAWPGQRPACGHRCRPKNPLGCLC
jgi:DNA polymerase III delta prime subunit